MSKVEVLTGGCLCGAVRYEATAPMRPVMVCHCGQCRRWHGSPGAYSNVPDDRFRMTEQRGLRWFASSAGARRGFCRECGASLFFRRGDGDSISFTAGSLDGTTHLQTSMHIFVADKGDWYEISDGLPQKAQYT
jgi:hypothetical protein